MHFNQRLLEYAHPFYHVTNEDGKRVDSRKLNIKDADDYSNYMEEGDCQAGIISSKRADRMQGKPFTVTGLCVRDGAYYGAYLTSCELINASFSNCFVYNTDMDSCSMANCHIYFTEGTDISNTWFTNCVLATASNSCVVYADANRLVNCTLKGNFAAFEGSSDLQRIATEKSTVRFAPYEVYSNIVLKDTIINCLRRWVHRWRQWRVAFYKARNLEKHYPELVGTKELKHIQKQYIKEFAALRFTRFSSKAAGKQPMAISDLYDHGEQHELPVRRYEWSVRRNYGEQRAISIPSFMDISP